MGAKRGRRIDEKRGGSRKDQGGGISPGHDGMLLQAEDAAQLQEHGPQHKHIDLQDVCKIQQHEGVTLLATDDVDGRCRNLHSKGVVGSLVFLG